MQIYYPFKVNVATWSQFHDVFVLGFRIIHTMYYIL